MRGGFKMQGYDTLLIARPTLGTDEVDTLVKKVTGAIEEHEGASVNVDQWGIKRLAYEVAKCREGNYILFTYDGKTATVNKVEEILNFHGDVIRFMTTKQIKAANKLAAKTARKEGHTSYRDKDYKDKE